MDENEWAASRFEEHRTRLRAVAYRMLGSRVEAEDAVQEAWLRLARAGADNVEDLGAWLTTVVARLCLNMLRGKQNRREELDGSMPEVPGGTMPEEEAVLADSVGLAMLVVLDTLTPAERLAFVLHDMFAVPFDEIGPMIDRTPEAARQLASRARRRVKGADHTPDLARQRRMVDAYLAAARDGDFQALVSLLHPDVVLRADAQASPSGESRVLHGIEAVAGGAVASAARARHTEVALVDGSVSLVMRTDGKVDVVLTFGVTDDLITEIDVIAAPERLRELQLSTLD